MDQETLALHDAVYQQLKRVIDPEVGQSIIKMGLVYDIQVNGGDVVVIMTLTTPGCPLGQSITRGVEGVVKELTWVSSVHVEIVWDPPWTPAMMR
ncbi:MAG: metal-sulfur cluster assembly factor [Gemmatimonadetes bacterium]|nr:metal-sulfur cluster assembly factor [Gemmatimonadota bacterium]